MSKVETLDASSDRVSFPDRGEMSLKQREVYDAIVTGPRGTLVGPLRAALHNPALADRWQKMGQVLRFETSLPKRLNELAILMTARRWNAPLEWAIHAGDAAAAGLSDYIIEAIRIGNTPDLATDEEAREIYEFARQLLQSGDVEQSVYVAVMTRWGEAGVVEITAVIGYYSMVAMTLNVHRIPLPPGVASTLEPDTSGLFVSPALS